MTNQELIEKFFTERFRGDEESYGFSIKPHLGKPVGSFSLFSKRSQFPMASKISDWYFIVSTSNTGTNHRYWKEHIELVTVTAKQWGKHIELVTVTARRLGINTISSPYADRNKFQMYMGRKINDNLVDLVHDMKINSYKSAWRCDLLCKFLKYQKLMENIHTLLDGEIQLGLPKNQVALVDTEEVQSLWGWLIKENPNKEDRELLQKTYILSRLLGKPAPKNAHATLLSTPTKRT